MDEYFRLRARKVEYNGNFDRGKESAVENPISFYFSVKNMLCPSLELSGGNSSNDRIVSLRCS